MADHDKFNPCPFCGGKNIRLSQNAGGWTMSAKCMSCGARGPESGRVIGVRVREAADAWNRRKEPKDG